MQFDSLPFQRRPPLVLVILLFSFSSAGCGSDSNFGTVHGVVRVDGEPLTTGTVRFVPTSGRAARGKIQPDGTFTLGTHGKSDGALIGTHRVAIIAYEVLGPSPDPSAPRNPAMTRPAKPLVSQRYMAPGTSGLTFEVNAGHNEPEFDLASPGRSLPPAKSRPGAK